MKYFNPLIIAFLLLISSCSSNNDNATQSLSSFTRLDKIISQFSNIPSDRQQQIVDSLAMPLADYTYLMGAYDGNIIASIDSISQTAAFKMFEPEVEKVFASTEFLKEELGKIDANKRKSLPELPNHTYYGIVSPYRQQVMLVDSAVYIALNHYLGANHAAYGSMPDYIRELKTPQRILLDTSEAIVAVEYPYIDSNNPTAIQLFLYEGALLKAVSALTGITDAATLMGWSAEQLSNVNSNEANLWHKMAADNMIYTSDMSLARRLSEPAPASTPISANMPGRLGRYIGYRIVCTYLEKHPDTKLSTLLSPDFYNDPSSLIDSGYSPN